MRLVTARGGNYAEDDMHSQTVAAANPSGSRLSLWRTVGEVALIFLVFFIQGTYAAPDVNETHYLSKARHYWDPSWCRDDFFLNSADAHQVFYWTYGWLSRWIPFASMAWCGRILTWGLMAWAWRRLSEAIVPGGLYAVLSAALFVALNERFSMAGEWVVGGVEAKGFAYALVFFGLGSLVRKQWTSALLLFGGAAAFHVVVGGWSLVAAGVVWLSSRDRTPFRALMLPLAGAALLSLPGLLPALALSRGVDAETLAEANRIYVFERLYHHLLPQRFPPQFIARHLLLVFAFVGLVLVTPLDERLRRLKAFVAATVGISAAGMAISLLVEVNPDLSASLLRYYWFRLADVMVPLGVALVSVGAFARWQFRAPTWHTAATLAAIAACAAHLGQVMWQRHRDPRPPADRGIANVAAWREMCDWLSRETPADAVVLTPRLAETFRWYAGRAEVVNRKDIPQDVRGIVEWWRRMSRIHRAPPESVVPWRESLAELGSRRLIELGDEFGASYVLTDAYPELDLERVGPRSPSFAIYRLRPRGTGR